MRFHLSSTFSSSRRNAGVDAPAAADGIALLVSDCLPHGRCVFTPRTAANETLPADAAPRIQPVPRRPRTMQEWLT